MLIRWTVRVLLYVAMILTMIFSGWYVWIVFLVGLLLIEALDVVLLIVQHRLEINELKRRITWLKGE